MSESEDELDELGDSNGRKSVARVSRAGAGKKKQEADDQEGEEGVEEGEDAKARRIAAEDKELRIIPRERAVKIWTAELGNPAATFQWDPANHRQFKCGVCFDTPVIRCKAMTLRQHCKRNKHTEALKVMVGRGGEGGGKKEEEEEERPLVKQAAVFVQGMSSNKKKKNKNIVPSPEPSEEEEEEVVVAEIEKKKKKKTPPAPKKRERAPKRTEKKKNNTPSPKKKKQKPVEEEDDRDDVIDIAPVSRDLEDDWKRYVAKNLGPKQREAMFARRLSKIMDEFENGGGGRK